MSPGITRRVSNWLARHGYVVVPTWRWPSYELEQHLRQLFERYSIDTVLDVGANEGQYVEFLRQHVGYQGLVVSFEPIPELAEKLRQRASGQSNWIVRNVALGSEDARLPFTITAHSDLSSFLTPDASRIGMDRVRDALKVERQVLVDVRRLDRMFEELKRERPIHSTYLKIDTQGYDLHVIEGAGELLGQIRGVQSEMTLLPMYEGAPDILTAMAAFRARGLDVTGLFPVVRDERMRLIDVDCVMIQRPANSTDGARRAG